MSSSADRRREKIVEVLRASEAPLSGTALGAACGVSRQVVVQDVALLRERGVDVVSTNRGYVLGRAGRCTRLFKCHHTAAQTPDELRLIVDLGGRVDDVFVNHRIYGIVRSELGIGCRRDVERFMDDLAGGRSEPLMQITGGYHFHHVSAADQKTLDEIEAALRERGFLAELSDYERSSLSLG